MANPAPVLDAARRILNEVYWSPVREATGEDFEALEEALNVALDLRNAARCFLSERDLIGRDPDIDAWSKRVEAAVSHMRAVCEEAEGRQ
jgi:hypothetical protein